MLATLAVAPLLWFGLGRVGLLYGLASAILIVWKHRENLARLRHGTENRLSLMKAKRT
jgi:glycerol-3-phosphate acyltransferase PlsY